MAAPPTTKIQVNWSDKSPIPMVNVYADTPDELPGLVDYVDQNYASWVAIGVHAHASANVIKGTYGTPAVATPPAAAGQALPQPVQQAAVGDAHFCECAMPMKLRNGKFGNFYSCPKNMSDPTRCKKTINV